MALKTLDQWVEGNKETRDHPDTIAAARYIYRHRDALGLSDAFHKLGNRITVDPPTFQARAMKRSKAGA